MGGSSKKGGGTAPPDFSKAAMTGQQGPMGSVSWSMGPNGSPVMNTNFTGQAANT